MKKKFSRILGVGLTLMMLTSLLTGTVVSALSQPQVVITTGQNVISQVNSDYNVTFIISNQALTTGNTVTLTLPSNTVVAAPTATIGASPGWLTPTTWGNSVTGNGAWTFSAAARTITYTLAGADVIGGTAAVSINITAGLTNPTTAGDYTLTVKTTKEPTAVASAAYAIANPTIPAVSGIVQGYNASDVLLYENTGAGAVLAALGTVGVTRVVLGPGTYDEAATIPIAAGQTLTSSGGAAVTIISDANASGGGGEGSVTLATAVGATRATLDGLTVTGGVIMNGPATVTNSVLSVPTGAGTALTVPANGNTAAATPAVSSGNTITAGGGQNGLAVAAGEFATSTGDTFSAGISATLGNGTAIANSGTVTVSGASISGASGVGLTSAVAAAVSTITGSSFSGLAMALNILDGKVTMTTSTIDNCGVASATAPMAAIKVTTLTGANTVKITNSTISNSPENILEVDAAAAAVFVTFNTLTGNTKSFDNDVAAVLDARNNWWGVDTGPAVASEAVAGGSVLVDPWLVHPVSSPMIATAVPAATTVSGKATVGVDFVNTVGPTTIVGLAKYDANPVAGSPTLTDAKAYYDVFASGAGAGTVTLTFYGISTTGARVWAWSSTQSTWVLASLQAVDLFQGAVVVTLTPLTSPNIGNLTALEFVLTEPLTPPLAGAPAPTLPPMGAVDVSLKPSFSWTAVAGAVSYDFELAEYTAGGNPYAVPSLFINSDSTVTTGRIQQTPLEYNNTYAWRVRGVRGEGDVGPWTESFFTTMKEPADPPPPPPPPVEIIQMDPPAAPQIIVEIPPAPAPVNVIPEALIWVVIAVGAVLVIAVIILIVRTRRVA